MGPEIKSASYLIIDDTSELKFAIKTVNCSVWSTFYLVFKTIWLLIISREVIPRHALCSLEKLAGFWSQGDCTGCFVGGNLSPNIQGQTECSHSRTDRFENSLISKHKQIAKHVAIDGWLCHCNAATMPKFLFQVYEVLAELWMCVVIFVNFCLMWIQFYDLYVHSNKFAATVLWF